MVTLVITLDEKGRLNVAGPVDDLVACYAMLELAKDVVRTRAAQKSVQIVPATHLPTP